jgi:long-chain acyl-CoA synthetase
MYRNVLARAQSEGRLRRLQAWQEGSRRVKRLTGLNIGPLVFRPLHRALGGKLRFLVSGGAALSPATATDFFSLGLPLLQGWGMTEASPAIAVQRFSRRRFLTTRHYEDHAGSVGRPVPGVDVQLIDVPEKDIRVAVNGEGEVIVRGQNVFQGYWQAEEATREAKLDGWLRTGDLARIDRQGNIFLTGRSKYVIVLDSGEKVHPDELEDQLRRSDVLQDVCIVGRRLRDRTQVTAIVYPDLEAARAAGAARGEQALQQRVAAEIDRLGRDLAAYKRVSRIELADSPLPKTPLLKVARGQIADAYDFDFERWLASGE